MEVRCASCAEYKRNPQSCELIKIKASVYWVMNLILNSLSRDHFKKWIWWHLPIQ